MPSNRRPRISVVLATHDRRKTLLHTLRRLVLCGFPREQLEIIVVDNASTDGTSGTIRDADLIIPLRRNRGSCAKAYGVDEACGEFVVFLDDDSFPRPGSLERMIEHFEGDPGLGCAAFQVHLPDGGQESSALPGVFVGCGVGFRAKALREVGGLDRTLFMQAEEYDLSFRLASAGWRVETFEDLHVEHLKTATARRSARTAMYDIRNNLRVAARYLPQSAHRIYRDDWITRYRWLAECDHHESAFRRGLMTGRMLALVERPAYRAHRLRPQVFEQFFQWQLVEDRMKELATAGIRRILLADLGKNIYAFFRAAAVIGLDVSAIADDRFSAPRRDYRGIPILTLGRALGGEVDAIVVSNMSSVHAAQTLLRLRRDTEKPAHSWFHVATDSPSLGNSPCPAPQSDDIPVRETVSSVA